jgi:UDP-N-acetylglucosamine diphosphorylase / glucose-1-phosphate thymidylyltransferase / UDP-N-acetylgalactosamine diphosphorylase / glucosamine-1-phosphate N-acetyltransferase / galactosamine-1-phosphate N-acetyltransferase
MIDITSYLQDFSAFFPELQNKLPWTVPGTIEHTLSQKIRSLSRDYRIKGDIAIHKTARIEEHVVLKGIIVISEGCFVGAHAYLRGGVFLGNQSVIGPGCEVKSSAIMQHSALAHFNFVGDSLVGSMVNMEAGSVIANHHNERKDKTISVLINGQRSTIAVTKFGALIGDHAKVGANAVLSPGTILEPSSVVRRLELVEQCPVL